MRIVIQAAMTEEITPFLAAAQLFPQPQPDWEYGVAAGWETRLAGQDVLLVRSGIGLTNAAIAGTVACRYFHPDLVFAVGTCGGLGRGMIAGDQVVGSAYRFAQADATIFGYERGQVPQMPAMYEAATSVIAAAQQLNPLDLAAATTATVNRPRVPRTVIGEVISGDAFIQRELAPATRELFPAAVAADMESASLAQACAAAGVPFASVRTVSDMCDWTEAEAQAADSEFLTLNADYVKDNAATSQAPQSRREYVYDLAAEQFLQLLDVLIEQTV